MGGGCVGIISVVSISVSVRVSEVGVTVGLSCVWCLSHI